MRQNLDSEVTAPRVRAAPREFHDINTCAALHAVASGDSERAL